MGASAVREKMLAAGLAEPVIWAFERALAQVRAGATGLIAEKDIEAPSGLPHLRGLEEAAANPELLGRLAVIKLNGGLGTGMGLDRAKSLLPVKGDDTFLDFIARQILHLRRQPGAEGLSFYLMNSFSTREDSLAYLKKYPELGRGEALDFLQSRVPKVNPDTLQPLSWPADPELEWCPPGHGDIYPSLLGSGLIERLRTRGIRYLFVSNSDNLGATVSPVLLQYFADSGWSFLMEVAERTAADRKGGHLARRRSDGRLLLRESVQCPEEETDQFQDITRHRHFNTNNLWIRLDHLADALEEHGGALPLPLICNLKTVDPRDPKSPPALQVESAMGAAIECFEKSGAVVVPRERFAPVKTTSDLLVLRSDACETTPDHRLVLAPSRQGQPPVVDLDSKHYKVMDNFDRALGRAVPSLRDCKSLAVSGPVIFEPGVVIRGEVRVANVGAEPRTLRAGVYENREAHLS
jgi:UDP-N-acetylglucosamine pyrophosphorylase